MKLTASPTTITVSALTPNFTLEELTHSQAASRLGLDNTPPPQARANLQSLAEMLERVRGILGHPVLVSSGYRSPAVNAAVGGSKNSAHCKGLAVDFTCPGYGTPLAVCAALAQAPTIGYDQLIHEYRSWVHLAIGSPGAQPRRQLLTIDSTGTRPGLIG